MHSPRIPARLALALLVLVAAVGVSDAQTRPAPAKGVEVEDSARLFSADAVHKAEAQLGFESRAFQVPIRIETIDSLHGDPVGEVAIRRAKQSSRDGLYVLIAREDKKIEVLASRRFRDVVPPAAQQAIRDAFISGLQESDKDEGLRKGAAAIVKALAGAKEAAPAVHDGDEGGHLVVRGQVRLTLAGAQQVVAGAIRKAEEMGVRMNVAVVDDGGHLLSFARMDGARPASAATATSKAVSAATFRQASGPIPPGTTAPDPVLNLSLQLAASAGGGIVTALPGGIPVVVDGQVIGAVGVGGGSGDQDVAVARAGVESFEALIRHPKPSASDEPARPADSDGSKPAGRKD